MKNAKAQEYVARGSWFQLPMMGTYIYLLYVYDAQVPWVSFWALPSHIGSALFFYCLVRLYFFNARKKGLITNGPFRYTRHPMYTGLMLMDLIFWLPSPVSLDPSFFLLQAMFVSLLVCAAYFQEKETLARFGEAAERYYAKTPRLFFMYPFVRGAESPLL